jgi:hypothetical protein
MFPVGTIYPLVSDLYVPINTQVGFSSERKVGVLLLLLGSYNLTSTQEQVLMLLDEYMKEDFASGNSEKK